MLKIYTLINDFSLCTPLRVKEGVVNVVFSGGCKALNQNGSYSTTDLAVQQALESDSGFNVTFKLSKEFPVLEEKKKVFEGETSDPHIPGAGIVCGDNGITKTCSTVNEAAEWLVELGCKKTDVNTSSKAIAVASTLGYDLIFEKGNSE